MTILSSRSSGGADILVCLQPKAGVSLRLCRGSTELAEVTAGRNACPTKLVIPIVRFTLERVVEVVVLPARQRDRRRAQVRRQEQRAPALALADVNPLVVTRQVVRRRIEREHDMPERQRGGSAFEQRAMAK